MRLAERAPVCFLGLLVLSIPLAFTLQPCPQKRVVQPDEPIAREMPAVPELNVALRPEHGCGQPANRPKPVQCSSTSAEDIEMVVSANNRLTSRCWQRATRHDPKLDRGRVVVSTHITSDGTFSDVSVDGTQSSSLQNCITAVVRGWKMRAPGCETDVKFVLVFE